MLDRPVEVLPNLNGWGGTSKLVDLVVTAVVEKPLVRDRFGRSKVGRRRLSSVRLECKMRGSWFVFTYSRKDGFKASRGDSGITQGEDIIMSTSGVGSGVGDCIRIEAVKGALCGRGDMSIASNGQGDDEGAGGVMTNSNLLLTKHPN